MFYSFLLIYYLIIFYCSCQVLWNCLHLRFHQNAQSSTLLMQAKLCGWGQLTPTHPLNSWDACNACLCVSKEHQTQSNSRTRTCINPFSQIQRHFRVVLKPTQLWTLDCLKTEVCTRVSKGLVQGCMWHMTWKNPKTKKNIKKKDRAVAAHDSHTVCHVCPRVAQEQFLVNYIIFGYFWHDKPHL